MNRTRIASFRWMAAAAAWAACTVSAQADTGAPLGPTSPPAAKVSMKAKTSPWVQAASKHNGSGIGLRYSVPGQLQPGQAATVQLQFVGVTAEGASAELRAPEGSTMTTQEGLAVSRIALPVNLVTTLTLRIVPAGDGLQTLDVFTSQADRSSAQSVPLKVGSGEAKLKAMGKAQTTPSGEKVISLPAQTPTK